MENNDESNFHDPHVVMTRTDLEQIRSIAIKIQVESNRLVLKMDDHQFRTYCYVMGVQAWLRSKGLLKVILD